MIQKGIHITTVIIIISVILFKLFRNNIKLQETGFLKRYTSEDLNYFSVVGFGDSDRLTKWNKRIEVQILPPFQKADSLEIEKIIGELRPLIGKTEIFLVKDDGNVMIHFPQTVEEFNSYKSNNITLEPRAFATADIDISGNTEKAFIYIMPYLRGKGRMNSFRHEFCHAIGLWGHSKKIFREPHLLGVTSFADIEAYEVDLELPTSLPDADQRAIRLLYEDSLSPNLSKRNFIERIRKNASTKIP